MNELLRSFIMGALGNIDSGIMNMLKNGYNYEYARQVVCSGFILGIVTLGGVMVWSVKILNY